MILHISVLEKFIPPFIDFLEDHFEEDNKHIFLILGDCCSHAIIQKKNVINFENFGIKNIIKLYKFTKMAEKIILHGLSGNKLVVLLSLQPWLLKKCYWAIWGGDLYSYKLANRSLGWYRNEIFRRFFIRRLGHLVTYVEGDVDLARKWYGARGQYHECLMYPSNLYKEVKIPDKTGNALTIQIGNSADPSNEHIEIFEILSCHKNENIKIYAPLSYGNPEYAKKVIEKGKEIFNDKFIPITDFMNYDCYLKYLAGIEVGIFNHRRQQGMGNIITLLGLGKKVYIRADVTSWGLYEKIGVKTFSIDELNLSLLCEKDRANNKLAVMHYFSPTLLQKQLGAIFARDHY